MYNGQLEGLISAALADGELTEKEKQILFKKAQSMGIDLDEFEMVLDARLVELKKAEKAKAESSAPKSNKLGDVKKCPACGAIVQSYQGACPECGYAFENIAANSSTQKLSELLDKIMVENNALKLKEGMWDDDLDDDLDQRIVSAIQHFPIPNTKSDLFEFITSLQTKISGKYGKVYERKCEECVLKAKSLFPNDKMFADIINKFEQDQLSRKQKRRKLLLSVVVILAICIIAGVVSYNKSELRTNCTVARTKVLSLLQKNKTDDAVKVIKNFEVVGIVPDNISDACAATVKQYLGNNQIDKATETYNDFRSRFGEYSLYRCRESIQDYYIKQHKYDEGKNYITEDCNSCFEEYVQKCLHEMCKNGEKAKAVEFANKNVGLFSGRYSGGKDVAMKKLNQIINSY